VWLDLVGIRIDLSESDEATRDFVQKNWPEFLVAAGPNPDVRLRATAAPALMEVLPHEMEVRQDGDLWSFTRLDLDAHLDVSTGAAELRYFGRTGLVNFLRMSLSVLLREHGGALFHAASVQFDGGVLFFPGVSGTGKSTIAGLAAPRAVLSDEISGLRPWKGRIHAFPTPFWGDLPRTRAAEAGPLLGIVLLRRDDALSLTSATSAEAVAALLEGANVFEPQVAPGAMRRILAAMNDLATVPCHRLSFRLPSNPWPLLDRSLRDR
jgi:hypothetical protein